MFIAVDARIMSPKHIGAGQVYSGKLEERSGRVLDPRSRCCVRASGKTYDLVCQNWENLIPFIKRA